MTPDDTPALPTPLQRGLVSRRTALVGAGGLALTGVLSACTGSSAARKPSTTPAVDRSDREPIVNWSNWPDYIDVGDDGLSHPTLTAFTRATGITVRYTEDYSDNEKFYAEVAPQLAAGQDVGRDVWCSTDWMVARLIRLGYVQRLDHSAIPNLSRLESSLRNVEFDPGRHYSVPWQSGFTGIAFNRKATGGHSVDTVTQLFTDAALRGRVTLLTDMQDTVGLTMLDMGIDPAAFTDAEFDRAMTRLTSVKESGQLKGFTGNEYTQDLDNGKIAACLAYTGDIVQLQASNPALGYTLPKSGHLLWSDNFVIPNHASHKANAEKLINYYYQPATMAAVEDYVDYISPVSGSREALLNSDPDTAQNTLIFPTATILARSHVFRGMTKDQDARYNRAFQRLINS